MTKESLILRGGKVAFASVSGGFTEAIAISKGTVLAVSTDEIDALDGASTRVVVLSGRLALPAFGDTHVHAVSAGFESLRRNLLGLRTRQECLDRIAVYAAGLAADAWVLGGGWTLEALPGGAPSAAAH